MNNFIGKLFAALISLVGFAAAADDSRPNIILIMADDLGYGDVGFTGNKIIKTPSLDQMAREGAVMTNFHSGGPVCSPTRGTYLTGRHHYRYGVFFANVGHLPREEITISEVLKEKGYATGHFGKWHLGTLSKDFSPKGKKRKPAENFSPPAWHGYDSSFVTESAIALWNPAKGKRAIDNPFWENGVALDPDEPSLQGGASRVVMDRVLPFIEKAVKKDKPFFTVIWFHAPHQDIFAGPEYLEMYKGYGEAAHYYGVVTEMDEQIGRLREALKAMGVDKNTLITFTSDNGPEGAEVKGKLAGITDGLRGRKRSLYEGGVRVPTLALWPDHIKAGRVISAEASTLDYLPTINDVVGYEMPDDRPIDGTSILSLLEGEKFVRGKAIPFYSKGKLSLIEGDYKLVTTAKRHDQAELYNLVTDRSETTDIASNHPERVKGMTGQIKAFLTSAKASHRGDDYGDSNFKPVDEWPQGGDK